MDANAIRFRCGCGLLAVALLGLVACTDEPVPHAEESAPEKAGLALGQSSLRFLRIEEIGDTSGRDAYDDIVPATVTIQPQALNAVGTPVSARVESLHVRPGQSVAAGAALLTLQSAEVAAARAALVQAAARSAAADDLLRRQEEMLARGVGLEVERVAAQTAAREAHAELAAARETAALIGRGSGDRFTLRAAVDGVVLAVHARPGAVVSAESGALVEVGDPHRLQIVAHIPESAVAQLDAAGEAQVNIPAIDARVQATIDGVGRVVDGEQRRLPVYLSLGQPLVGLTPGMLADVRLPRADGAVLSLPIAAVLIKNGGRRVVYVQDADGQFEMRPVRTGRAGDGRVAILEGLQRGDKVVVQGALLLDGQAEQLL